MGDSWAKLLPWVDLDLSGNSISLGVYLIFHSQ